ncbi:MAG TPA: pyridoxal 5'-phosphate synthase glutaminase subunit PdxT [Myxococcales bacterium]|nr:pyridoxal 5'-phosphate synthase glutaminase subunit PdxT [Myxococcales bacterium]
MRVGVLALQGGYAAHAALLRALGHEVVLVRAADHADGLDGLVLPGGESSAQLRLLDAELEAALHAHVRAGLPVLATCAGLVLAATRVARSQRAFGWLDVDVERNGWGRQLHSAEARADDGTPLTLIRAPRIRRVGSGVEVMRSLRGEPVLVRAGRVVGATFHPELDGDPWLHIEAFTSR